MQVYSLSLIPRRLGSSKISLTYGGKRLTTTVKVVRYYNPFRSFKIGKKQVRSYFDAKNVYDIGNYNIDLTYKKKKDLQNIYRKSVGKSVKVALKKNWKIVKMYRQTVGPNYEFKNGDKIIKGKSKNHPYKIHIEVKNKKTGAVCEYVLGR